MKASRLFFTKLSCTVYNRVYIVVTSSSFLNLHRSLLGISLGKSHLLKFSTEALARGLSFLVYIFDDRYHVCHKSKTNVVRLTCSQINFLGSVDSAGNPSYTEVYHSDLAH